jgi:hypothetical protein
MWEFSSAYEGGRRSFFSTIGVANPLMVAAAHGHSSIIKILHENGVDVNQKWNGYNALTLAAEEGLRRAVETLLDLKASMQFISENGTSRTLFDSATSISIPEQADENSLAVLLVKRGCFRMRSQQAALTKERGIEIEIENERCLPVLAYISDI